MKKKLFWSLLLITMIILCCYNAYAAQTGVSGNLTWEIDDKGTLTISGSVLLPPGIDEQ